MRILISHTNFPAQFRRLAPSLAEAGHDVVFIAKCCEWNAPKVKGFKLIRYELHRQGGGEALHPYLRRFESAILEGQAVYRVCRKLRDDGWIPEFIINHVGFGNGMYLRDVFPEAQRIGLFEWYYNSIGADVDFLRQGQVTEDQALRLRGWNAQTLLELADCDIGVVPTKWQLKQFPKHFNSRLEVIHEGVDLNQMENVKNNNSCTLECLKDLSGKEVLTYVSRGFEEYRGFPQVMKTIEILQKKRPNLHVLIAGADVVAYGSCRSDGRTWGQWAKQDLKLDLGRTHWLGPLQTDQYHEVLARSTVHFYLTVPFVLSWSLIEAMAAGCCIVASDTAPVQEVLQDNVNARLVDFFSSQIQAEAIGSLLDDAAERERLAAAAQVASKSYGSEQGVESWLKLLSRNGDQTAQSRGKAAFIAV